MYFTDHASPHVHVEYQGHEALVAIADGAVIEGALPSAPWPLYVSGAWTIVMYWNKIGQPHRPCGA